MRHRKKTGRLGRSSAHRKATMSALVCSLIEEKRITTTLAKAKNARVLAEKMVTLGRKGDLAARRQALRKLLQRKPVSVLFGEIAPKYDGRNGGYTRIVKLGKRKSDSSEMAILEWVDVEVPDKKKKQAPAEESK